MAIKTYQGSCHCGNIRFEADIDLSKGTGKCNCSFCKKTRNWSAIIQPSAFRLISGSDSLGEYKFNTNSNSHHFCKNCGIRTFTKGFVAEIGGHYVSIYIPALDNVEPHELIEAPLQYFDGLNNNWMNTPGEVRHL